MTTNATNKITKMIKELHKPEKYTDSWDEQVRRSKETNLLLINLRGEMVSSGIYKCTSWYCKDSKKTHTTNDVCFPFRSTADVWCFDCSQWL